MVDTTRLGLLALGIGGIYASYLTQGIVSEFLSTKRYGPNLERFKHLEALNGAQSLVCFVWAWLVLFIEGTRSKDKSTDYPSWTAYWKAGITNCIGPACGLFALKNISFTAQVLAKSCKMVPVMIAGTLLHGKSYSALEYTCMTLIGIGVALFARKGSSKVTAKLASPNAALGYGLCFLNLAFDGYTNAAQDEINRNYPKNSPNHMMCWMNFWTSVYYALYLFLLTGNGWEMINFCSMHVDAAFDVLMFCACGAVGQLFIFFTIKAFGSLINTLVCTTRKFFNILISVWWNSNPLLPTQWIAVFMVFVGLISGTLAKRPHHKKAT